MCKLVTHERVWDVKSHLAPHVKNHVPPLWTHLPCYVDAAYCYRRSSVFDLSVCLSVGLSVMIVTFVSTAKVAVPIEMPFGMLCRVGPGKHVRWGCTLPPPGE